MKRAVDCEGLTVTQQLTVSMGALRSQMPVTRIRSMILFYSQ